MFEHVAIGAPRWLWPACGIAVTLGLLVVWAYTRGPARGGVKPWAALLKTLAIVAMAICLFEPLRRGQRPRPQANVVSLLADNSQSMRIKNQSSGESPSDRLASVLDANAAWRVRLDQDFDVRTYAFDTRLQTIDDFGELDFNGHASSLHDALETAAARFRNRPVAGMLLFTDGNATDIPAPAEDFSHLGFPIYPVVDPSRDEPFTDTRITRVTSSQTDFEAAPVTLNVQAASTGFGQHRMVALLRDEQGKEIEQQTFTPTDDEPSDIRFRFRPEKSGVQFYQVAVFPEGQRHAFDRGDVGSDVTLANNSRVVCVDRRSGPYRVLYVAGRPNWEFKFLRRSLQEDAEVQLVGLLRIARKEPKFTFREKTVDSTNPLFAGFTADDDAQQFDEPVYIRLGIKEQNELRDGFPKTKDELYAYHAVILDDIEAASFSTDQMLMLREFVSTRGGGLLLLGGQESFAKGKYDQTPIGELSPVYMASRSAEHVDGRFRVQLTREGWLAPWMRLRSTELAEKKRLAEMPLFATLNPTGGIKPGASVYATVETDERSDIPALVAQRFGRGRAAALLIGDMWRWAMQRKTTDNQDLPQLWRQTIRWLVSEVPRQVDVRVAAQPDPTKPVQIDVTVQDEEFKPLDNAKVHLAVRDPTGETMTLSVEPSDEKAGVYTAHYWPSASGGYRAIASVAAPDGTELGERTTGWTSEPAAAEYRSLQPNRELLNQIARQTGGDVISQNALAKFVASLPDRKVAITEHWVYPLWHRPWVLMFAIVCLCGEWGLRRWKGLP